MKYKKSLFILLLLTMLTLGLYGTTDIQRVGVPFIENFPKSVYKASNQNWAIAQDENNIIYIANNAGLLSFDGSNWKLFEMKNKIILRSVATDKNGRIFTGGFEEFGYWEYDDKGVLRYKSLVPLIPEGVELSDEIWKIYTDGDRVLFQSFSTIFIYEDNKIKVVDNKATQNQPFLFLHKVDHRFFVEVISIGLFELKGDQLHYLEGSEALGQTGILSILPFDKQKILIGTAKNGLFIYDGNSFTKWNTEAEEFLKTHQLNNGAKVLDKNFAFGTILNGVIVLDQTGKIVQHINKTNGLQNNTVLNLLTDQEKNLWCTLDNGIDRIEINSPLYFYLDKSGKFGTVYSSIIHQGYIYLGTNQGLFYSEWKGGGQNQRRHFNFKLIANSQGQVWDLSVFDGNLICGHNTGTYLVKGTEIEKISSTNGGWFITRSRISSDILIQGTYTKLVIYRKNNLGSFTKLQEVSGFSAPIKYLQQDTKGNIWVSHAYKGLYRLKLSADYAKVLEVKEYGKASGLPGSHRINIFDLNGKIIFATGQGFYVYDEISNRFHPYQQLNSKLGTFSRSNKVIRADEQQYWFIRKGNIALVDFKKAGQPDIDSNMFNVLKSRIFHDFENINKINEGLYLISIDDGFVFYHQAKQLAAGTKLPRVVIRQVEITGDRDSLLSDFGQQGKNIRIDYQNRNMTIHYALPFYRQGDIKFQYLLEGYSSQWSEWTNQAEKSFTNLPAGDYVFKVRAKYNEQMVSDLSSFRFSILPPFYATKVALFIYLLLFLILAFYLRKWYQKNLVRHQQEIEAKLQKEKENHLKEEAIINEQKLMKLKAEKLETELESKAREATNSAMNIVYKNELLQKIKEELGELKDGQGNKLSADQLRKIRKVIDEGINDERDWDLFEKSFNETHEQFFHKLKVNYPELVPNDLKLCAYLRMNMSSKEMASLLNISVRGVEIRRYRLRKKLKLEHEKNLVEFLMEI